MNAEKLFGTRDLYEILQLKRDAEILDGEKTVLEVHYFILYYYLISIRCSEEKLL